MGKLETAVEFIQNLDSKDKIEVRRGKFYTQVADRVTAFRRAYGDTGSIIPEIKICDEKMVMISVDVFIDGRLVARGHAEEYRGSSNVNKTSALENCETSAIGRALSNLGLHGGEYASAFEVVNAIESKPDSTVEERKALAQEYSLWLDALNECHTSGDFAGIVEAYHSIDPEVADALHMGAPKNAQGNWGPMTTALKTFLKESESAYWAQCKDIAAAIEELSHDDEINEALAELTGEVEKQRVWNSLTDETKNKIKAMKQEH